MGNDYIFAGLGASSCILVHELKRKGLLNNKKILVIDPSTKIVNDKTYCFWSKDTEEITQDFSAMASHCWSKISTDSHPPQEMGDLKYYHINSLELYNATKRILTQHRAIFLNEAVLEVGSAQQPFVVSESGTYKAQTVFDSRPPHFDKALPEDQNILQSFVGYKITLDDKALNPDACTLMDFNVPQQNHTQFVYVLPFSEHTALVELTRFGTQAISENNAAPVLHRYIEEKFGPYKLKDIERGVIPMFTDLKPPKPLPGVIPLGTRANKVKPSTGYAFKKMYAHAKSICQNESAKKEESRFRFYDRLLILILALWPHQGKPIFQRLFQVRDTAYILKFLDEKTSIWEDARMFYKLPVSIFLRSCFTFWVRKQKPSLLLFGSLLLYFVLDLFVPQIAEPVMYGLLATGLLIVGIPHGAMDHMTEALSNTKRITLSFILKYLALMSSVYMLWVLSPTIALLGFVLYSAWHFGETDVVEWNIKTPFIGLLWGALFFIALFSSHPTETQNILYLLDVNVVGLSLDVSLVYMSAIGVSFALALLFKRAQWFSLVCYLLFAQWLPLVIAFGTYFIFHHSYQGWSHLRASLGQDNVALFKNALPFNVGALALFLFFFLNPQASFEKNISLLFVFISCISFPHIFCMHRFYASRRKTQKTGDAFLSASS
ncbi:MAG: hypothetical protein CMH56_14285 [Myxococcales bacterium]|nr:hypothetical protein [Myxococcales bacterium]|tara:strand:- start:2448 stop:4433 length:1986 start_codon:yes stop_codon:yes gene_type:complete